MIHDAYLHDAMRTTWAMCQGALATLLSTPPASIVARRKLPAVKGQVAILPIHGMISQRSSIWSELFGGTSTEGLAAAYSRAVNDDRIAAIVLDVDSPGGTVSGVEEAADIIAAGSLLKTTAAIANSEAASAAYWLASQVGANQRRFAAAPGADVGSIGVYRMHEDYSEMLAQDGVMVTFIGTPEYKTEANPYAPLTEEAYEHHMAQVQATYEQFAGAVARGRGVSKGSVAEKFGKGRMFESREAVAIGLVDRVATMSEILGELGVGATAELTSAEANDVTQSLCHAWTCGMPEPMRDWRKEFHERMARYWA